MHEPAESWSYERLQNSITIAQNSTYIDVNAQGSSDRQTLQGFAEIKKNITSTFSRLLITSSIEDAKPLVAFAMLPCRTNTESRFDIVPPFEVYPSKSILYKTLYELPDVRGQNTSLTDENTLMDLLGSCSGCKVEDVQVIRSSGKYRIYG